ncbi:unnamed protein product [Prorocentrum cordatum]|uniref:Very-long-chain 3-oxoacyl-CoA synthase n=1 Tax=Prorocentrum cordatum TaxID=2364126 RepID=A0ABN9V8J4_9DINO|nr:unnamed protein product [Polarella glacialis]
MLVMENCGCAPGLPPSSDCLQDVATTSGACDIPSGSKVVSCSRWTPCWTLYDLASQGTAYFLILIIQSMTVVAGRRGSRILFAPAMNRLPWCMCVAAWIVGLVACWARYD